MLQSYFTSERVWTIIVSNNIIFIHFIQFKTQDDKKNSAKMKIKYVIFWYIFDMILQFQYILNKFI